MVTKRRECEVTKIGQTVLEENWQQPSHTRVHNCHSTRNGSNQYKRVHDTRVVDTISFVPPFCTMASSQ